MEGEKVDEVGHEADVALVQVNNAVQVVHEEVMAEVPAVMMSLREPDAGDGRDTDDREGKVSENAAAAAAVLDLAEDRKYVIQDAADESDAFSAGSLIGA